MKARLKSILASRYRKVLCVSDYVLDQEREAGVPRAERLHHFINTDRFRPDQAARREVRQSLGVGEEFVAVTVAYLIKDKGIDVAIKALAQLPEGIVLWVVGDGPERGTLRGFGPGPGPGAAGSSFSAPSGMSSRFLQAADCALCPSIWAEAAGLVNLEALACGLPVVASRIGGIPEFIDDGRSGFLCVPGDDRGLADRIHRLAADPALRAG